MYQHFMKLHQIKFVCALQNHDFFIFTFYCSIHNHIQCSYNLMLTYTILINLLISHKIKTYFDISKKSKLIISTKVCECCVNFAISLSYADPQKKKKKKKKHLHVSAQFHSVKIITAYKFITLPLFAVCMTKNTVQGHKTTTVLQHRHIVHSVLIRYIFLRKQLVFLF